MCQKRSKNEIDYFLLHFVLCLFHQTFSHTCKKYKSFIFWDTFFYRFWDKTYASTTNFFFQSCSLETCAVRMVTIKKTTEKNLFFQKHTNKKIQNQNDRSMNQILTNCFSFLMLIFVCFLINYSHTVRKKWKFLVFQKLFFLKFEIKHMYQYQISCFWHALSKHIQWESIPSRKQLKQFFLSKTQKTLDSNLKWDIHVWVSSQNCHLSFCLFVLCVFFHKTPTVVKK